MKVAIRIFSFLLPVLVLSSCVSIKKHRQLAEELLQLMILRDQAYQDSDKDGVIDLLDQEENTPANAEVDTKGRTLDSDQDGVPDYRDKEPYYFLRRGEEVDSDGVVKGITYERTKKIIGEALAGYNSPASGITASDRELLDPVYFDPGETQIDLSDYPSLKIMARIMTENPAMHLVVEGHSDQSEEEVINEKLAYLRAWAVVDHFAQIHGMSRERFVILWKGPENPITPIKNSRLNRRVEFRIAGPGDYERAQPPKIQQF